MRTSEKTDYMAKPCAKVVPKLGARSAISQESGSGAGAESSTNKKKEERLAAHEIKRKSEGKGNNVNEG